MVGEEYVEVVVKIPKSVLNYVKQIGSIPTIDVQCVANAIFDGVLLPEGHGRISDMDAAIKCIEEVKGEDAAWAIALIEWACSKRTLIEADKTESEESDGVLQN